MNNNDVEGNTFMHELFHIVGFDHAWYPPMIGTAGTVMGNNTNVQNIACYNFQGAFNPNVLTNPLIPPFNYTYDNSVYYQMAEEFKDQTEAEFLKYSAEGDSATVLDALTERAAGALAEFENTPQVKTGNFLIPGGGEYHTAAEEIGYIEFLLGTPARYTRNFTRKYSFNNGDSTTKATLLVNSAPAFDGYGTYQETSITKSLENFGLLRSAYGGVESFWGGSFIYTNPPALWSVYDDEIVVTEPIDNQYIYVGKIIPGNYSWDEAMALSAAEEEDGWELPSPDVLQQIQEYSHGGYTTAGFFEAIGLNTSVSSYIYDSYDAWYLWTTYIVNGTVAQRVGFSDVLTNISSTPTSLGKSTAATVMLVKRIDISVDLSIPRTLVINPTNDDGTRKGPDVTTYIPFCKLVEDTDADSDTYGQMIPGTEYDPFWIHNHNRFNPEYPAYPDNTRTDQVYDQSFCPCLYTQQSYVSLGNTYTYTVMGESQDLEALKLLLGAFYSIGAAAIEDEEVFDKLLPDEFIQSSGIPALKDRDIYRTNSHSSIVNGWLKSISDAVAYDNGYTIIAQNQDLTNIKIPYGVGYFGIGQKTTWPIYFNYNWREYLLDNQAVSTEDLEAIGVDPDLYLPEGRGNVYLPSYLRESRESELTGIGPQTHNLRFRYNMGDQYSNSPYYNPLFNQDYTHTVYGLCSSQTRYSVMNYVWNSRREANPNYPSSSIARFGPTDMELLEFDKLMLSGHPGMQDIISAGKQIGFEGSYITTNPGGSTFEGGGVWTYLNNFFQAVIQYEGDEVAGCMDETAMNYNPEATYDLQSPYFSICTPYIYGCLNDDILETVDFNNVPIDYSNSDLVNSYDSHNYNNYYHSGNINPATGNPYQDGDIPGKDFGIEHSQYYVEEEIQINGLKIPARLVNVNTDDGSCFKIGCMEDSAQGEWASGYDPVATLSDPSLCFYEAVPRNSILRVYCADNTYDNITPCNTFSVDTVRLIVNNADGDVHNYTNDFYIQEFVISDLVLQPIQQAQEYTNFGLEASQHNNAINKNPIFTGVESFPFNPNNDQNISNVEIDDDALFYIIKNRVFGYDFAANILGTYHSRRFNCVENPILANGTGGCYFYRHNNESYASSPLQGCTIRTAHSITEGNCTNVVLHEGGYVVDSSWLTGDFQFYGSTVCPDTNPLYIVGGSLASSGLEDYGEETTIAPPLSEHQIHPNVGYPCLDPDSAEECPEGEPLGFRGPNFSVGRVLVDIFLHTETGDSYVGGIIIEDINNEKQISSYDAKTGLKKQRLYSRNEVLKLGVQLTDIEKAAKNIRKVKEKIINLTIFTHN